MVSIDTFRQLALSFSGAMEHAHFEKASFRVNKKIFSTLDIVTKRVVLKLPEIDQSVFCSFNTSIVYPVPGNWGKHGWTCFELNKIKRVCCWMH